MDHHRYLTMNVTIETEMRWNGSSNWNSLPTIVPSMISMYSNRQSNNFASLLSLSLIEFYVHHHHHGDDMCVFVVVVVVAVNDDLFGNDDDNKNISVEQYDLNMLYNVHFDGKMDYYDVLR